MSKNKKTLLLLRRYFILLLFLILTACSSSRAFQKDETELVSMQIIDRNGFSETISNPDRLAPYHHIDFFNSQPYKKVLRVFGRDVEGRSHSKITSYHENGQLWQYLEVVDGRAHGSYREYYPNGILKIEAEVIEGAPDITSPAQTSWLFDHISRVWDPQGHLMAVIKYVKGQLEGSSLYYHANGQLSKSLTYHNNLIEGVAYLYNPEGLIIEELFYEKGIKEGLSRGYWNKEKNHLSYEENYEKGLLQSGQYYNQGGEMISSIINGSGKQVIFYPEGTHQLTVEHHQGLPSGMIHCFSSTGELQNSYCVKEGKKQGEELIYYPKKITGERIQPRLSIHWNEDVIQGLVKTWYENGSLESEKEMQQNKKHGHSFAWYPSGELMLHEEYAQEKLIKGSYFQKGDKTAVSTIEDGEGTATLYTSEGQFLKKIFYQKGNPISY